MCWGGGGTFVIFLFTKSVQRPTRHTLEIPVIYIKDISFHCIASLSFPANPNADSSAIILTYSALYEANDLEGKMR